MRGARQYPAKHSAGDVSAKIFPDISAFGEQSIRGFKMQIIFLKLNEERGLSRLSGQMTKVFDK